MGTKISEYAFEANGVKYFRGNAHSVLLGAVGRKKDPVGAKAYLDVKTRIRGEHLGGDVRYKTTLAIDWATTSRADVGVGGVLTFLGLEGTGSIAVEKAKTANLVLTFFDVEPGALRRILNTRANGALTSLASEGADGRVVSGVWAVVTAEVSELFSTAGSLSVSADAAGSALTLTASGGKSGAQRIVYPPGATFAYELQKVGDWDDGKTKVGELKLDEKGMG